MKYEDLKCEFCGGHGEKEKFIEPYGDSPITCTFCNGTGIDQDQLMKFLTNSCERFIYGGEEGMLSNKNGRWIKIKTIN